MNKFSEIKKDSPIIIDTCIFMVGIEKLSAAKLTFSYEFKCNGDVVFLGKSTHCFLDLKGVPVLIEKRYPEFFADLKAIYEAGKPE